VIDLVIDTVIILSYYFTELLVDIILLFLKFYNYKIIK